MLENNDRLRADMPWLELESEDLDAPEAAKQPEVTPYSRTDLVTDEEMKVLVSGLCFFFPCHLLLAFFRLSLLFPSAHLI